jgi:hypothetical protein
LFEVEFLLSLGSIAITASPCFNNCIACICKLCQFNQINDSWMINWSSPHKIQCKGYSIVCI